MTIHPMMPYTSNNCEETELDSTTNEADQAQSDAMDELEEKQSTSDVCTASKTKKPNSASMNGVSDEANVEEDDDEESSEDKPEWNGIPWTEDNVSLVFRNPSEINPIATVPFSHLLLSISVNRTNDLRRSCQRKESPGRNKTANRVKR
jgi:hypothetical protein